jgi:hypothetical protein
MSRSLPRKNVCSGSENRPPVSPEANERSEETSEKSRKMKNQLAILRRMLDRPDKPVRMRKHLRSRKIPGQ